LVGGYLQLRLMGARMHVNSQEAKFRQIEARYRQALAAEAELTEARRRLEALETLSGARVLWAGGLHALQYAALADVQLLQLRASQSYNVTPGAGAKTNANGVVTAPAQPAVAREKVTIYLEARDSGEKPGELIPQFQDRIASQPFFKTNLGEIRLVARSPVQTDVEGVSQPFVTFGLECIFAERER
jgi:hypothetical protein